MLLENTFAFSAYTWIMLEAYNLNGKKPVIKVNLWYKTASGTMQRLLCGSKGKMYVFINNQETFQPSH